MVAGVCVYVCVCMCVCTHVRVCRVRIWSRVYVFGYAFRDKMAYDRRMLLCFMNVLLSGRCKR